MKQDSKNQGGRPRAFDRDTVLDAAVRVFWEKSYEGTSLDDLTAAMGINRSSIYATFGKKHDLFLVAIDRYAAVQGMAQSTPLRDEPSIREAVGGYCRQIVKTVSSGDSPRGCLIGSVATEVAERDPVVREKIAGNLFHSEPCDVWRSQSRRVDRPMGSRHNPRRIGASHGLACLARPGSP